MARKRMSSCIRPCHNLELPSPTLNCNTKPQISLKKIDHYQIWTQLPHLDFPKLAYTAWTTPPDFSQQIDTVFFKRRVDDWKARIKTQIKGELDKILTWPSIIGPYSQGTIFFGKRGQMATG